MSEAFKYDNYDDNSFEANSKNAHLGTQYSKQKPPLPSAKKLPTRNSSRNLSKVSHSVEPAQINFNSRKAKLISQYLRLKQQLKDLAIKMDEIVQKEREKKKKKGEENTVEDDPQIVEIKKEIKEQGSKIQKYKSDIAKLRKNLDQYDEDKIVDRENELKHLKKELATLENEKKSLMKIRKTQTKAIKEEEDVDSLNKKARIEEQLRELTQKNKERNIEINEKERQVRRLHECYCLKEEKIRDIQFKIRQNKIINDDINEYAIDEMEEEIKEMERERLEIEKEGNEKLRTIEKEKKELTDELKRKKLILQEKQKELRLSQLKHKEIVRLVCSSQSYQTRYEKENRGSSKRVISRKGRTAPKIEECQDQDNSLSGIKPLQVHNPANDKQEYGFSANLQEEIIDDN